MEPVRGRSPALPPSSPPAIEHDFVVDGPRSQSLPQRSALPEHLLSPETVRPLPPRTPTSTRSRWRDTSSEYYTAAWGSPYEVSPSSRSARTALSEQVASEQLSESSPIPDFGLSRLVPNRLGDLNLPQPELSPLGKLTASIGTHNDDQELTPRSRKKRWVQLPQSEKASDGTRWWSDESAHSGSDQEQKRARRKSSSLPRPRPKLLRGHKSRASNQTINQQTFWAELREQSSDMSTSLFESRWAATPPADDAMQKPVESSLFSSSWADTPPPAESEQKKVESSLVSSRWADTPPPLETTQKETGGVERMVNNAENYLAWPLSAGAKDDSGASGEEDRRDALRDEPAPTKDIEVDAQTRETGNTPLPELLPTESAQDKDEPIEDIKAVPSSPTKMRLEAPRFKTKVSWRGKTCVITIPNVDYDALGFAKPLSLSEIEARLKDLEEAGFNTSGFDIPDESSDGGSGPVHAKPIFPDETEARSMAPADGAKVRLPDLKRWAQYMDELTEKKLAALGVSIGAEEPAVQDMSRQSSSQYPPLPFSPPIPSNSATSLGRPPLVRGHSHAMSVASPISPLNGPFGHMHRHSTFTGPTGFPFTQLHQPTQPLNLAGIGPFSPQEQQPIQQPGIPGLRSFSPQNQFVPPAFNRVGSPAQLAALRNDFAGIRGPGSPLSQQYMGQSPQSMQSQPVLNGAVAHAQHVPPLRSLPQLPEEDDEEELLEKSEPELAEESEAPAYVPPHKRAQLNANIAVPTPRGHRHNISEGLERDILEAEKRHEADRQNYIEVEEESSGLTSQSEHEAPPTKLDMPAEKDPLSQDYVVQESVHSHKKSASRLNGTAPAFKFNPGASFQPTPSTAFTFGAASAPQPNGKPTFGHNRQQSSGAFNAAAPEFKPTGMSSAPKAEFSFSSNGPSFKAALAPPKLSSGTGDGSGSAIFGKVDIPDFVKPARRSKAVTIRRPEDSSGQSLGSGTEYEDEEGRIAQSEARLKRQRKVDDDGDEVPKFAEPTPIPAPDQFILKSQPEESEQEREVSLDYGEESDGTGAQEDTPKKDTETVDDAFDHDFDLAYGEPKSTELDSKAVYHKHNASSSLSALAKPFEPFSPPDTQKIQAPELESGEISELEEGEIKEHDHPTTSPVRASEPTASAGAERELTPKVSDVPFSPRPDNIVEDEPSFDEIDAVMRRLNGEEAEQSAQEGANVSPLPSPSSHPMPGVTYLPEWTRSDAPSPSPRRLPPPFKPAVNSPTIHDRTYSGERVINGWPQVNRLNKAAEIPTSDWSADFSVQDEEKLHQRSNFLDNHIDGLIGRLLDQRLQPLEETLRNIHTTVNKRPTSRDLAKKRSSSTIESDADDEDDMFEEQRHRPVSRGKDKRFDQFKAVVLEALREQSPKQAPQSSFNMQDLDSYLADMKASFARAASSSLELEDIRAVVEDAVVKQSQALVPTTRDPDGHDSAHRRDMSELEGRLNQTLAGMLEEANLRRAAEERETESRRAFQQADEELRLLREKSRDDDERINSAARNREELILQLDKAEEAQGELQDQVKNLEAENAATYATLEEYRMSSNQWRQHIDEATSEREKMESRMSDLKAELEESRESGNKWRQDIDQATREREELEKTINGLERQLGESQESSSGMRRRLEKLQADMASAAGQLASEKSLWNTKDMEHRKKCESLEAQVSAHVQSRSKLEEELRELREGAREASEAKLVLDQMRMSNSSLDDMVRKLQGDLAEQQSLAAKHERDSHDAKEAGRTEVHRVRMSMQTDIDAANHQVNVVRAELESELSKVRSELENVQTEAETAKTRHERSLEEEETSRRETIRKVNEANSAALDDARHKHETSLKELHAGHRRVLDHALEDKQRSESFLNERLALSDAKLHHFQDRVLHLEERLEIAKSAAQAAAMNAQSRGVSSAKVPTLAASSIPEKVSPQALRESILVLQEQLQERESTIESLQNQVDNEGPAKLKSRDDEIAWLRELLSVRSEDLTDLVNTLARPTFDRNAVRDLAIRIRTSLQMEQQEKERSSQSQQTISGQAMASLSNFATPKATQLSSAFSKWRSNMESSALKNAPRGSGRPRSYTPSKAAHSTAVPPGYVDGLMTPPASNLRNTPSPDPAASLPAPRLQSRPGSSSNMSMSGPPRVKSRQASASSEVPTTPLLRSQSYDKDAEDNKIHMQAFEEGIDEDEDEDLDIADNEPPAFRSLESELEDVEGDEVMA